MIFYCIWASVHSLSVFFCDYEKTPLFHGLALALAIYTYMYICLRWQWSTVECTVNAVKMLNEINNSINIMSATSFDEKCKTLNIKMVDFSVDACALCAHSCYYSWNWILWGWVFEWASYFLPPRSPPSFLSFIPRADIPCTLYFTIPQLDPIQHLCLHWKMNKRLQSEWGNAQHTNPNTRNLPWSEFDSQIEWL